MALIDITPVMTSNTAPAPYVVSASSINSSIYEAWKAFDTDLGTQWFANGATGFITLDYGVQTKVNAFSITARNDTSMTYQNTAPKTFHLYGSNDNVTFDTLFSTSGQSYWGISEVRLFKLSSQANYRYYKVLISENNGHTTAAGFATLKFFKDDAIVPTVTMRKASQSYGVAMNSTINIKSKQNDEREGMLGCANDGSNYGTLYVVDDTGKAKMIKSALSIGTVLFKGTATTAGGTYTLSDNLSNYQFVLVESSVSSGSYEKNFLFIPTKDISYGSPTEAYALTVFGSTSYNYFVPFKFSADNKFIVGANKVQNGWTNAGISQVIGIK